MRAALDAAAWRETMQSVNDELRNLRRDALVAYILAHDPPAPGDRDRRTSCTSTSSSTSQMDACMQTSRIRLALSTVQLFVTRCLMNLEPDVASGGSIRQDRWAWMKRYRVWEANRKIFLWPENWLEPELRDGKSPFFRELESDLLKSDITDRAGRGRLPRLPQEARRRRPAGDRRLPPPAGRAAARPRTTSSTSFGRTNGKTRQYWYRRYEYGYWTPWEKVALDIEGDLVSR